LDPIARGGKIMSTPKPVILLAEDDDNDVFFMRRALQKSQLDFAVQVVSDGQQATDYLSGTGKFSNREQYPFPSVILLDLKMPFLDGFEVLTWIRKQPSFNEVPVAVLTSSAEERDRRRARELGARAYFVKPPRPETIQEIVQFIGQPREKAVT
jgi:CheY-like chemotaxis protein